MSYLPIYLLSYLTRGTGADVLKMYSRIGLTLTLRLSFQVHHPSRRIIDSCKKALSEGIPCICSRYVFTYCRRLI